ncbi:MAG: Type II secretion system protein E [Candidatus Peregrinibacteria bacterium GW2011_GWA2_47_7]|nr:MAG: Type II secretion system protein E [Candidatus Peregrinibacteria bacterium GW2011_GWA2_47_7]
MLGFMGQTMEHLKKAADLSYGMVLCTGPTGSGKTTTLYALLQGYNTPEKKIITLEDPVEYHIAGITQSQINEKRGYTFESGLRSILRQDPDVIMIGEIRDLATAQSAMQAALTGHVVLATLHTNTAVETIPRLLTIGVPAFMMAPALHTIVAQRLLRRVCPDCAEKRPLSAQEKKIFEETIAALSARGLQMAVPMPDTVPDGKGCENCNKTGYRGQMVLAEIFMVNDEVRSAILEGASATRLNELAQKQAMITMREDGILKALQGLTTLSEVYRVVSA